MQHDTIIENQNEILALLRKLVGSTKPSAGEDFEDMVPAPLTTTEAMDDLCAKFTDQGYRKKMVRTYKH